MCTKSFLAEVTLKNHIKFKHSDNKLFKCAVCDSQFKQRKHLNEHSLTVHDKNLRKEDYWQDLQKKTHECKNCGATFNRQTDLNVHLKVNHKGQDKFTCNKCTTNFKYKKSLKRHEVEMHRPDENVYECPTCQKMFKQERNMKRHQLIHGTI